MPRFSGLGAPYSPGMAEFGSPLAWQPGGRGRLSPAAFPTRGLEMEDGACATLRPYGCVTRRL